MSRRKKGTTPSFPCLVVPAELDSRSGFCYTAFEVDQILLAQVRSGGSCAEAETTGKGLGIAP